MIGNSNTCPAQLLSFDLETNNLLEKITIPNSISKNNTGIGKLVTPVVELKSGSCEVENVSLLK